MQARNHGAAAIGAANGGSNQLAPNASVSFTISIVSLTLDDGTAGQDPYVSTVTVNATDDEGTAATDDDTATINVNNATPSITIVKDVDANKDGTFADSETVAEGTRLVDYKFTVTAGNNAATDVLTVTSFVDANLPGVSDADLLAAFYTANGNSYTLAPNASATFYVNADQLAVLVTGSSYYSRPADPPVTAPFSSGCGQLASAIGDLDAPRAVIGATDQAMRRYLAPGLLAFTVTKPAPAARTACSPRRLATERARSPRPGRA